MTIYLHARNFYCRTVSRTHTISADRPLAILKKGFILESCAHAEKSGVIAGIRVALARRRCANLHIVEYNSDDYRAASHAFWSQFGEVTPLIEPIDERRGFLSLAGCVPKGSSVDELMTRAMLSCYEHLGLLIDWGGGQDRWIAKLVSGENAWIAAEDEASILQRLPLERLGIESRLYERFRHYGIRTVTELIATPRTFIESHLQISRKELDAYLLRGDSVVRELFPPKEILVAVDLEGSIEGETEQAINCVSSRAANELKIRSRQCNEITLTIKDCKGKRAHSVKLAKPLSGQEGIAAMSSSMIRDLVSNDLRSIELRLTNLTYRSIEQNDIWLRAHKPTSEHFEAATRTLRRKYGTASLQSGNEFAERITPRFAQLIYRERGLFLP